MSAGRSRSSFFVFLWRSGPLIAFFILYHFTGTDLVSQRPSRLVRNEARPSHGLGALLSSADSFPSVPTGIREYDPDKTNEWLNEDALYLDRREKIPESARFFRNIDGRPDTSIFDSDVVMQYLSLFGHFARIQRPGRDRSWWHTGEFKDRRHTIPFITGDAFRMMADFFCDNEQQCKDLPKVMANPEHPVYKRLKPGQSIIVFTTCHDQHALFDAPLPLLEASNFTLVIVVHNGDEALEKSHEHFLDDSRVKAYFTQNCALGGPHAKVVCVPIGLEPRQFSMHGWRPEPMMGAMLAALQAPTPAEIVKKNKRTAFAAWSVGTFKRERGPLLEMIERGGAYHADHVDGEMKPLPNPDKPLPSDFPKGPYSFVTIGGGGQLEHYHRHIINHAAVLSPRGNGLDTLRAWEALYLGRVVFTKTSTMDPVFDYFPVHILQNWTDLTEGLVKEVVEFYSSPEGRSSLSTVKLYMFYWLCEVGRAANRGDEWCSIKALETSLRRPEFS